MDMIDLGLLAVGVYLAVMILIRLMKAKHQQMLTAMREQWQQQKEREKREQKPLL